MRKIAKTKITNSSLTTVPKAVKMFLNLKNGNFLEWFVNDDHEIVIKRANNDKK